MSTFLVVLVSLLVAGIVIGAYMDWFGLWVSKEDMKEEVDKAKARMQRLAKRMGIKPSETNDNASETATR